jgi:hypothetical protein
MDRVSIILVSFTTSTSRGCTIAGGGAGAVIIS